MFFIHGEVCALSTELSARIANKCRTCFCVLTLFNEMVPMQNTHARRISDIKSLGIHTICMQDMAL